MNIKFKIKNESKKNITKEDFLINELEIISYIEEKNTYYLSRKNISCSPIELIISKNSSFITLNIFKYSCENDWKLALGLLSHLTEILNSEVKQDSFIYRSKGILEYRYDRVLIRALEELKNNDIILKYINRNVFLSYEILNQILNSNNPVEEFSKFIFNIQYANATSAIRRNYYDENNDLVAIYFINIDNNTIMLYNPNIDEEKYSYYVNLVKIENDDYKIVDSMKYDEFINKLNKNDYEFIDANQIILKKGFKL